MFSQRQKTSQAPQPPFAEDAQLDSNTTVESRMTIRNDDISIVNMLQRQAFSLEGIEYYRFELFRMYNLDQIVRVKYSTADKRGTAVPGHHYLPVKGNVVFEKGANLTHFDVVLHDDDGWEVSVHFPHFFFLQGNLLSIDYKHVLFVCVHTT